MLSMHTLYNLYEIIDANLFNSIYPDALGLQHSILVLNLHARLDKNI